MMPLTKVKERVLLTKERVVRAKGPSRIKAVRVFGKKGKLNQLEMTGDDWWWYDDGWESSYDDWSWHVNQVVWNDMVSLGMSPRKQSLKLSLMKVKGRLTTQLVA